MYRSRLSSINSIGDEDDDREFVYDPEQRITRTLTLSITCSSITFIGQGKEETIIKGAFAIEQRQNIMFKQMTVTNPSGAGLYINDAEIEVNDVVVRNCKAYALNMNASANSTTLVARRCQFKECQGGLSSNENSSSYFHDCTFHTHKVFGLYVDKSTVHLRGEATAVHSNGHNGILAQALGKVIIHLPSHHNTIYNNGKGDRFTELGGSITNVED